MVYGSRKFLTSGYVASLIVNGHSLDDRRSTFLRTFSLGFGVVTWSSKKQATTALSSSEADIVQQLQ